MQGIDLVVQHGDVVASCGIIPKYVQIAPGLQVIRFISPQIGQANIEGRHYSLASVHSDTQVIEELAVLRDS